VVGGGVIGLCSAYHLAKRGQKVVVAEKADYLAGEASSDNAGITWPFAQMLGEPFIYKFVKDSLEAHERLTAAGLRYDFQKIGAIWIFYEAESMRQLERRLETMPSTEDYRVLSGEEVTAMEPEITPEVVGGIIFPNVTHGEANKLCSELQREIERLGVEVRTSTEVRSFRKESGKILSAVAESGEIAADRFVISAGPWSCTLSDDLGFAIPTIPIKGHIISWRVERPMLTHAIWTPSGAVYPSWGHVVNAGGGMDYVGYDKTPGQRTIDRLNATAVRALPRLETKTPNAWAGLRPGTPDAMPIIGPAPNYSNLIVATGAYHEGFTTAPLTGEIVSDLVIHGKSELAYLGDYDPGRFNA
jgi:glycine oxidase